LVIKKTLVSILVGLMVLLAASFAVGKGVKVLSNSLSQFISTLNSSKPEGTAYWIAFQMMFSLGVGTS
jgi:hypothetical protein